MDHDTKLGQGYFSTAFANHKVYTFKQACNWVQNLPYKRNSTKDDPLIVIKESCGTCSSKHELIKRLAEENEIDQCELVLCMFKMSAANTPKVASVLTKYGLEYIPEAHTYLTLNGKILDLTFPDGSNLAYLKDVIYKEIISADQIRANKSETHKSFMKQWGNEHDVAYTFEELWSIREECIASLAE